MRSREPLRPAAIDFRLLCRIKSWKVGELYYENTKVGIKIFHCLYIITRNIERIGDHELNISSEILKIAMAEK